MHKTLSNGRFRIYARLDHYIWLSRCVYRDDLESCQRQKGRWQSQGDARKDNQNFGIHHNGKGTRKHSTIGNAEADRTKHKGDFRDFGHFGEDFRKTERKTEEKHKKSILMKFF